jgi:NAD-dependent deacetylase
MSASEASAQRLAELVAACRHGVAFSGAGISTESGIPDFRSPGGVWTRFRNVLFDEFLASAEARHEYWRQKAEGMREFGSAAPNEGHRALAAWQRRGLIRRVITQNIDGLHQAAGSDGVLELHGTVLEVSCLDCGWRGDSKPLSARFLETGAVPPCPACEAGRLKHATISFGQNLDPDVIDAAVEEARRCDLFLVLGSSLVVEPAASLPRIARSRGATLIIINRDPTPLDRVAGLVIRESIGATLAAAEALLTRS